VVGSIYAPLSRLGTPRDHRSGKVSASKQNKGAQAGDAKNQKPGGSKEKLIRLDDLIPKQNVRGGRQIYFGSSNTETNNQNKGTS
jgi:hypothetical protein